MEQLNIIDIDRFILDYIETLSSKVQHLTLLQKQLLISAFIFVEDEQGVENTSDTSDVFDSKNIIQSLFLGWWVRKNFSKIDV